MIFFVFILIMTALVVGGSVELALKNWGKMEKYALHGNIIIIGL